MTRTVEDKKDAPEEAAPKEEEDAPTASAPAEEAKAKDEDPAEPTTMTDVSAETLNNVAERLKFFFSNANIRGDRFMQNQINIRHDSGKRPVPIEVLLRFNTLKKFTTDPKVVIAAAQQLLSEQLVVVNSNDKNDSSAAALQRVHSFTMEMMNDNVPKTLVVSNLPIVTKKKENATEEDDDEATYAVSMDDIRKVFEEFGPVAMIRMRFGPSPKQQQQQQQAKKKDEGEEEHHDRHDSPGAGRHQPRVQYRYPAQYAFVEYETAADCERALTEVSTTKQGSDDVEPKRKLQLGGSELQVTSLQDYMDQQKMKRQAKKEEKKSSTPQDKLKPANGGDGGGSGSTEKENDNNKGGESASSSAAYTIDWKPGCVIKLEGLADGCDREAIMTAVATAMEYSTVDALKDDQLVYVDYSRGQTTGAIRFFEPNYKIQTLLSKLYCPTTTTSATATAAAAAAAASTDAGGDADKQEKKVEEGGEGEDKAKDDDAATVIEIAGSTVEKAYLLEGEQEEQYWKEFIDFKNHQKKRQAESSSSEKRQYGNNNRGKHQHHHRNPKRQKRR